MDPARRPWLDLYRTDSHSIQPDAETALDMFHATVRRRRDAAFVHYFSRSISAEEIESVSDALALGLQRRGVGHGDRVAMFLQNVPQVLIATLAAWKCGAVLVPCNPMLRDRELVKILTDSGSRVLISQEDLYADVARSVVPSTAVE